MRDTIQGMAEWESGSSLFPSFASGGRFRASAGFVAMWQSRLTWNSESFPRLISLSRETKWLSACLKTSVSKMVRGTARSQHLDSKRKRTPEELLSPTGGSWKKSPHRMS